MLAVRAIDVFYGRARALFEVSLHVAPGELVVMLGANGAGKTTLLRAVSGLLVAGAGRIDFEGHDLRRRACHEIVALGLGHVPEGRRVFGALSVRENLELGAFLVRDRRRRDRALARVLALFPALEARLAQAARTLSGGEQQMLAIGRALMSEPRLLLLDEPSLGLAPIRVQEIYREIARVNRESGTAMLLVDQNAGAALRVARRGYVLESGRVVCEGPAEELRTNPRVVEAYLGGRPVPRALANGGDPP